MSTPNVLNIDETTYGVYTSTLLDDASAAITLASIDSITMTLIEFSTEVVVNSREAQDILNANNCTMHATSGLFTWEIQPADTAIVVSGASLSSREVHLATITVVWNTTKKMHREIKLRIKNLTSVPQS
ncbi:hypothetical protein OAG36_00625 [bacterium]|nr:hypothetical protein [bacterium]